MRVSEQKGRRLVFLFLSNLRDLNELKYKVVIVILYFTTHDVLEYGAPTDFSA